MAFKLICRPTDSRSVYLNEKPTMLWRLQLIIFFGLVSLILGEGCLIEDCNNQYHAAMQKSGIEDPEQSLTYCDILRAYQKCMASTAPSCRGNIPFHASDFSTKKLEEIYCIHKGSSISMTKTPKNEHRHRPSSSNSFRPSCHYYGNKKFRHCAFFGDPHLKTFDEKYQTCRVHGTWTLLDNLYMSVHVTNQPVVEHTSATAPTKISVTVKSASTPCTLEKRYEADGAYPLSNTFVDGTDRPGSDKTVYITFKEEEKDKRETVEIYMNYIASKLIIRRTDKYLAFSALLPEEVIKESIAYNEAKTELCTTGCPITEQLDLILPKENALSAKQALKECTSTENLSYDLKNNLTDNYLDWCVFDLMTAGSTHDFVTVAYSAQLDAMKMDPNSLRNRTRPLDWFYVVADQSTSTTSRNFSIQLPFWVYLASMFISILRA